MTIYQILMTKYQRLFTNDQRLLKIYSLKDVRKNLYEIFALFMQNKANFGNDKMNINIDTTSNYKEFVPLAGPKNKANSNPI